MNKPQTIDQILLAYGRWIAGEYKPNGEDVLDHFQAEQAINKEIANAELSGRISERCEMKLVYETITRGEFNERTEYLRSKLTELEANGE